MTDARYRMWDAITHKDLIERRLFRKKIFLLKSIGNHGLQPLVYAHISVRYGVVHM